MLKGDDLEGASSEKNRRASTSADVTGDGVSELSMDKCRDAKKKAIQKFKEGTGSKKAVKPKK